MHIPELGCYEQFWIVFEIKNLKFDNLTLKAKRQKTRISMKNVQVPFEGDLKFSILAKPQFNGSLVHLVHVA